jgi:uncharacterized SAM-binding protein YcdF (DUF218 family)
VAICVLVPGYGGRFRAVERWRMAVALRTLDRYGGGMLVLSGHRGEAQRLARLAPRRDLVLETSARSTWENIEYSLRYLENAEQIAIASDWFHARRASSYLNQMRPDLAMRLVPARRPWWRGWSLRTGGAVYEALAAARRFVRTAR